MRDAEKGHPPSGETAYRDGRSSTTVLRLVFYATVVVQGIFALVTLILYDRLYKRSPLGTSALISSSMIGFSQGCLFLVVDRPHKTSTIAKFYMWGALSGIWTVWDLTF
jgi:hypothetical protein